MAKLADVIYDNPDRNVDEQTMAQRQNIEDEIARTQPLVAKKEPLAALEAQYNETESAEFLRKAQELKGKYSTMRRVRGDGNCFYRAIAFAMIERLLPRDNSWKSGIGFGRFCALITNWKERMLKVGYNEMTTEDFCDVFADFLKQLEDDPTEERLMKIFSTQAESDYIVVFMRLVTGAYLLENEALYGGFVDGARSMKEYVDHEINPVGRECDHLCITALSKALDVSIRIEYMDRSQAPAGGWHHDFTSSDGQEPFIYFLYRPGHYDILYK